MRQHKNGFGFFSIVLPLRTNFQCDSVFGVDFTHTHINDVLRCMFTSDIDKIFAYRIHYTFSDSKNDTFFLQLFLAVAVDSHPFVFFIRVKVKRFEVFLCDCSLVSTIKSDFKTKIQTHL